MKEVECYICCHFPKPKGSHKNLDRNSQRYLLSVVEMQNDCLGELGTSLSAECSGGLLKFKVFSTYLSTLYDRIKSNNQSFV